MDQLDPRLVEIEILSEADRAFVGGRSSYVYRKANPSGPKDWQRDAALFGLLAEGALVAAVTLRASKNYATVPDPNRPDPSYPLDDAAAQAIAKFLAGDPTLSLNITQVGRLRLYRLRDEILQRDRVRDDFGVLWAARHFRPDLEVLLRFRSPGEPFSVILIDVNKLKSLNSDLGNPGADKVLTGIFETLRDVVRPHEAYRLGGDEAGAVLPGVSLDVAKKLGEDIRAAVEARPWPGLDIKTKPT